MVQAAHVLVGGGTGFVGRHLVKCLKENGAKVRIITRKPDGRPDCISWDRIQSHGLPTETTSVVNLSGRNLFDPYPWTQSFKKELYDSRIETNRLLVKAIHKAENKPRSFVTVSGVGYYAPNENVEYDENWTQPETTSTSPNFMMDLARDWEKSSELDEQQAPTTRRVVIRAGVVLGRDGGVIQNLKLPFSLGLGGPLGDGKQWFPWIHVDDLANMFVFSIRNEHVSGFINGVAPEQVRNKQFVDSYARALNRPAFIPVPQFFINFAFGKDRGEVLLKGQRVKSKSGLLGFRYLYHNLQEACDEIVKS